MPAGGLSDAELLKRLGGVLREELHEKRCRAAGCGADGGRRGRRESRAEETCTHTYGLCGRQTLADWNSTTPDTAKTYWANGLLKFIDKASPKATMPTV